MCSVMFSFVLCFLFVLNTNVTVLSVTLDALNQAIRALRWLVTLVELIIHINIMLHDQSFYFIYFRYRYILIALLLVAENFYNLVFLLQLQPPG